MAGEVEATGRIRRIRGRPYKARECPVRGASSGGARANVDYCHAVNFPDQLPCRSKLKSPTKLGCRCANHGA